MKPLLLTSLFILSCSWSFHSPNQLHNKPSFSSGIVTLYPDTTSFEFQKAFYIENVFLNDSNFKIYTWEKDSVMPGHFEDKILFNFENGTEKYLIFYRLFKYHKTDIPTKKEDWDSGIFTILVNLNENNKSNIHKSIIVHPSLDNTAYSNSYYLPTEILFVDKKLIFSGNQQSEWENKYFKFVIDLNIDKNYSLNEFKTEYKKFELLE